MNKDFVAKSVFSVVRLNSTPITAVVLLSCLLLQQQLLVSCYFAVSTKLGNSAGKARSKKKIQLFIYYNLKQAPQTRNQFEVKNLKILIKMRGWLSRVGLSIGMGGGVVRIKVQFNHREA
jgi:hypothetical protein